MGGVNNSNKILDHRNHTCINWTSNFKIKIMCEPINFKNKSFAVYGLGLTGRSVVNFLKKNKALRISSWDDFSIKYNSKKRSKFKMDLNIADYIVISPGINIKKSKFKNLLLKNKKNYYRFRFVF